jgi:serine/threonine protein phosphatase PrpC
MFLKIGSWYMKQSKLLILLLFFPWCLQGALRYYTSIGYAQNQGSGQSQNCRFDLRLTSEDAKPFDAYAAIFDGVDGAGVAEYLRKNFYALFKAYNNSLLSANLLSTDPDPSYQAGFFFERPLAFLQKSFEKTKGNKVEKTDSTIDAVFLFDDKLFVINMGDSGAVTSGGKTAIEFHRGNFADNNWDTEANMKIIRVEELPKEPGQPKFIILANSSILHQNVNKQEISALVISSLSNYPGDLILAAKALIVNTIHAALRAQHIHLTSHKGMPSTGWPIKKPYIYGNDDFLPGYDPLFVDTYLKEYGKKINVNQTVVILQFHKISTDFVPFTIAQLNSVAKLINDEASKQKRTFFNKYQEEQDIIKYTEQYAMNALRSNGVPRVFRQGLRWYVGSWMPRFVKNAIFNKWFSWWIKKTGLSPVRVQWHTDLVQAITTRSYLPKQ